MLNDKHASERQALKDLLDEASEPIPTGGITITNDGNDAVIAYNSIVIMVRGPSDLNKLTHEVGELTKQLAELRRLLVKPTKE